MSDIELKVTPSRARVLSGEALPVKTTVQNRGAAPFATRDEMEASPYIFRLEPVQGGRDAYVVSEDGMVVSLANAPTKPNAMPDGLEVPPGGEASREDEIARYYSRPFLAGTYRLTAAQKLPDGVVTSPPAQVEIVVPHVLEWTGLVSPISAQRLTAFVQQDADGSLSVLQRNSRSGQPRHSVFFRRVQLPASAQAAQLAMAVKLDSTSAMGNWLALLLGDRLAAWYCYGNESRTHTNAAQVPVQNARLLPMGFESAAQNPVFFVYGGGRIHALQTTGLEIKAAWSFAVPFPLPAHTFLRARRGRELTDVTVVTVDVSNGNTIAQAVTHHVTTGVTDAARVLGKVPGPLADAGLGPLAGTDPAVAEDHLHVLTGPDEDGMLTYQTLPFSGSIPPAHKRQAPVTKVDRWAIAAMGREAPILARTGEGVLVSRDASSGWQSLATGVGTDSMLQLYTLDAHDYWAEWLDPQQGLRLERVIGE